MSKLNDLIKELCPNSVEYKTLGEVCEIGKGIQFNKENMLDEGSYPVINGGISPSGFIEQFNQNENTITISQGGASAGFVNWIKTKFWAGAHCYVLSPNKNVVLNRYVYHFAKQQEKKLQECQYGAGIPALAKSTVAELSIPLPPLAVQEEIVRILDNFTQLEAELEAELEKRKKQYEYYRDNLLTRESRVEVKKLGEIATITRGGNFQKKNFVENGFPCIHYGQMYTHFGTWTDKTLTFVEKSVFDKSKQAEPNDIVMAVTSENVEDVCKCTAWVGKEPIAVSGHTAIIHHNQNAKYLSYYFQSSAFYQQKVKLAHGTKVIEVTPDKLNNITIPLPPLEVQERIVNVLDNFDAICTDLKIGLPAEIEARKKQYEYYRDFLLTFANGENTISSSSAVQQFSSSAVQQNRRN